MYGKKEILSMIVHEKFINIRKKKIFFPLIGLRSLKSNISTIFYVNGKCQPTAKIENQT